MSIASSTSFYAVYPFHGVAEPLSAFSHLFAAGVFACLAEMLIRRTSPCGARRRGMMLYCGSVVSLLVVSGLYHLFPRDLVIRDVLQRIDHATIFVLIASTFTPIHIALLENLWRGGLRTVVWSFAAIGAFLSIAFLRSVPESVCLSFYLGLGWIGAISGGILWKRYGFYFVLPLLLGALAYTIGAVGDFLKFPVLVSGVVGPHEVFHFAVIAGIAFHWKFISGFAHRSVAQCRETRAFSLHSGSDSD